MLGITTANLDKKSIAILFVVLITPLIAWQGVFDRLADEYIDQSLTSAGAAYAAARGINAIVSTVQTGHVDMVFIEATPGEMLDPLNDLIERFSAIMLAALGSLALQKILLELVSDTFFNWAFTALAIVTAIALFQKNRAIFALAWRLFLSVFCIRFALALVVLANSWVDASFLAEEEQRKISQLERFETEASALETRTALIAEAKRKIESLNETVSSKKETLADTQEPLRALQLRYKAQNKVLNKAKEGSNACFGIITSLNCSPEVMA